MITIITLGLALLSGLISISQYSAYRQECIDEQSRFSYMILTVAHALTAVMAALMFFTYGKMSSFIFYSLDKFVKVLVMAEIILLTQDMVEVNKKYISIFLSIISYGAVALFFVDTFTQGGQLCQSPMGVYFSPIAPWHKALYFLYYMAYLVMLLVFAVYKGIMVSKKCEKHDWLLLLLVYGFSAAGFVSEVFIINYNLYYIPCAIFGNFISVILMRRLLQYHESISISRRVFSKEMDPGRTDICFVIDDQLKIIYQNKRAEVFAAIVRDSFVGRKINDVFEFSDAVFEQIEDNPDSIPFGISAVYPNNNHRVDMIIQHRLDSYGQRLATSVFVYNIEDVETVREIVSAEIIEDEDQMINNALSLTKGARALIVDEDIIFLNVLGRLLQQYEVFVTRAVSGNEAVDEVKNNVFDIIFMTYEMNRMNGYEAVRKIRSMQGDYYRQVPIVFITGNDINEVFNEFIEAGFNDFIKKPLSKRSLNSVLTRWLWQRFNANNTHEAQIEDKISPQMIELGNLLTSAIAMYEAGNYEKLSYVANGIKKISKIMELSDLADAASNFEEAIMFEDSERIEQLYNRIVKGIRSVVTINA